MNVHILVVNGNGKNVQTFSSRTKMTQAAKGLESFTMIPPIPVPRKADGILYVADLINRIHTEGENTILGELEAMEEFEDIDA